MLSSHYFSVQKLTFAGVGIDLPTTDTKLQYSLVKHPVILYGIILSSCFHFILVLHYVYVHITDFIEVTDSMPLLCQLLLCTLKVAVFLSKRQEVLLLIKEIHKMNLTAKDEELVIVQRENAKDNLLCSLYLRLVFFTGTSGVLHPVIYGLYVYFTQRKVIFIETYKASYFWDHSRLAGYSAVYVMNFVSLYFACMLSLAFDTLFSWFVSNIVAQFHIICHRYDDLALKYSKYDQHQFKTKLLSCVQYHRQALCLAGKLNQVYGEIIFIKFLIVCTEICSLVFRVSRPNDSMAEVAYKGLFLCAVALQLILYCWNGQRIKDEVFKTAGSLITALKTMEENKI